MDVTIRFGDLKDLKLLQDLNQELFNSEIENNHDDILDVNWPQKETGLEYFRLCLTDPNKFVIFAYVENEIAGYLTACTKVNHSWRSKIVGELENMFVLNKYRRNKVGTKLIEFMKNELIKRGVERALVSVYSKNLKAIKFYNVTGFNSWDQTLEVNLIENK